MKTNKIIKLTLASLISIQIAHLQAASSNAAASSSSAQLGTTQHRNIPGPEPSGILPTSHCKNH